MKKLIVILIVTICGCQTDLLIPCETVEGLQGEICREFIEVDDAPVGTVEYEYDSNNRVRVRAFKNNDNSTQKTLTYEYANGQLRAILESVGSTSIRTAFGFDEVDSLISIAYFSGGQIDSIFFIDRVDGKRISERMEVGNETIRFQEYRYRQSDGILDRISFHNADSTLRFYHRFEFFQDGSERIEKRSVDHILEKKTVIRRNESGQTTLIEVTDPQDEPLEVSTFTYDADGGITCSEIVSVDESRKTTFLYH